MKGNKKSREKLDYNILLEHREHPILGKIFKELVKDAHVKQPVSIAWTQSDWGGDWTTSDWAGDWTTSNWAGDWTTSNWAGDWTQSDWGGNSSS